MKRIFKISLTTTALAAIISAFTASAQISRRVYLMGNSVTDGINYSGFRNVVFGKGNNITLGRHMIPGTPMEFMYKNPTSGIFEQPYGGFQQAFANYAWDCVSLQPYDRGIEGTDGDKNMSLNFMALARQNNPDVQVYIFSRYPSNPLSTGAPNTEVHTADFWNSLWLNTYTGNFKREESREYFVNLVNAIRAADNSAGKPVLMIPVGDVFYEMNKIMAAGKIQGFNSIWGIYADGIHATSHMSYLIASTFYATMYKDDPRGLPVPSDFGNIGNDFRDSLQNVIYRVILNNTLSGVTQADLVPTTGVTITNKNISLSLLQTAQLNYTIQPANASNKSVNWVSENTSVVSVDKKGKILATGNGITRVKAVTLNGGFEDFANITVAGVFNSTSVTGVLAGWDVNGLGGVRTITATTFLNGVSTVNPSLKAIVADGLYANNFSGSWSGSDQTTSNFTSAIGGDEYFSFNVAPRDGRLISVKSIKINTISQNRTRVFGLFSNVKGFTESQVITTFTGSQSNIPITGHSNMPNGVEFRVYLYTPDSPNQYEAAGIGNEAGADFEIRGDLITPVDNEKPGTPTGINVSQLRDDRFFLSWNESTDNMVVWGYNVYLNGNKLNAELLKETTLQVNGLTSGQICNISVTAVDFVGNESNPGTISIVTNRRPTAVLNMGPYSGYAPLLVTFNGLSSTDPDTESGDVVLGFDWDFGDNSPQANANSVSHVYSVPGVFTLSFRVVDTRDLRSEYVYATITVAEAPDMANPTPPSDIWASEAGNNFLKLKWYKGTDDKIVAGYNLFMSGEKINTTLIADTSFMVSGLEESTEYLFEIQTQDGQGNTSENMMKILKTNTSPVAAIDFIKPNNISLPFVLTISALNSYDLDTEDTISTYNWSVNGKALTLSSKVIELEITSMDVYAFSLYLTDSKNQNGATVSQKFSTSLLSVNVGDDEKEGIVAYPNPLSDNILYFTTPCHIAIHNQMGQVVFRSTEKASGFDLRGLNNGLYLLDIDNKKTVKLIVNR